MIKMDIMSAYTGSYKDTGTIILQIAPKLLASYIFTLHIWNIFNIGQHHTSKLIIIGEHNESIRSYLSFIYFSMHRESAFIRFKPELLTSASKNTINVFQIILTSCYDSLNITL